MEQTFSDDPNALCEAREILRTGTAVLAVATLKGEPVCVTMPYVLYRGAMVIMVAPITRHGAALRENPRICLQVFRPADVAQFEDHPHEMPKVRLSGSLEFLSGEKTEEVTAAYAARFAETHRYVAKPEDGGAPHPLLFFQVVLDKEADYYRRTADAHLLKSSELLG